MTRLLAVALAIGFVMFGGIAASRANTGSGMVGDHPTDYLHDDLNNLREAHQLVVCGLRDKAWFDATLLSSAKRAFIDSVARSHGEQRLLTDIAFAIHDVVAENISVQTTIDDCRNFGGDLARDERAERLREIRQSLFLIQSGEIFVMPQAPAEAPASAFACVQRPLKSTFPVVQVRHTIPTHRTRPRGQVALMHC